VASECRVKPRIVVVGSVNMDLVIHAPRLPAPGETIAGSDFRWLPGGKGANQAVAAARMGAEVHFIGCVGDDDFGRRLRQGLEAEGIALDHLGVLADESTGVAMIVLDASGQNAIVLSAGANGRVTPAQIDAAHALIASAQMLVCQLETPLDAVARAIGIAREHGVPVILNPAPAAPLDEALLARVDYLVPNETEASLLSGVTVSDAPSAAAAARTLAAKGVAQVLITLGAKGVLSALRDGSVSSYPATPVAVVDTTGAGDTFVGSLAVELSGGRPLAQAIRFAQHAAALKITRIGAQTSIPLRADVEQFVTARSGAQHERPPP
jgi:ribokinase